MYHEAKFTVKIGKVEMQRHRREDWLLNWKYFLACLGCQVRDYWSLRTWRHTFDRLARHILEHVQTKLNWINWLQCSKLTEFSIAASAGTAMSDAG
eukprot:m.513298 g.513298  ORF g.513298 m.513298 type:complete len:96 (+) comp57438_c0_seq78:88-375(+)